MVSRGRTLLRASLSLTLFIPLVAFASCAEAGGDPSPAEDASVAMDTGSPGPDAAPDGGCDASDETCAPPLSCAEAPWCPVPTNLSAFAALTSVWGSSKNDVWAVGSNGTIVHWDGAAWALVPTPKSFYPPKIPVKNTFHTVWGSGSNDVWIASATDAVFHTGGYGGAETKWENARLPIEEGLDVPVFAIWGSSVADVRLGGTASVMFDETGEVVTVNGFTKTDGADGGIGWQGVPGTATVLGMWGPAANDLWLVGDNSTEVTWQRSISLHGTVAADAGGLTWAEIDSHSSVTLRALWGSSASDVWAVGDLGTIRHVTSADATDWQSVASPTREDLRAVWGFAADDVWAVGDAGTILHYDGHAWTTTLAAFPAGKKPALYGVWGSARDDVWIVGNGIALHYTGGELGDSGGSR
ncbi:MAG: hypothetical protein K0S65_3905 [Labilithrix sp.]|nr:hypothetical protein [Labilithrix sp.]